MFIGVVYALLAGLVWGLIFISPLMLPDYPAALQSAGRYLALGLLVLPIGWLGRRRLRLLTVRDWLVAAKLALVGNMIYYLFLASAIQRTGSAITTMIIGMVPVVVPVCANLFYSKREGRIAWRRLIPSLLCLAAGLILVNYTELTGTMADISLWRYLSGIIMALVSMACWTWYAMRNSRWLKENPKQHPIMWATAQGIAILPISLVAYGLVCWWLAWTHEGFSLPFGPRPGVFIPIMLGLAVLCSWVGTLCWNEASQRVPTVLLGPLVVFETLSGLLYTFLMRQHLPSLVTTAGIALLVLGVAVAMQTKSKGVRLVSLRRRRHER